MEQLWIDSSAGGTSALPEKKETDFFAELTQVCLFLFVLFVLLNHDGLPSTINTFMIKILISRNVLFLFIFSLWKGNVLIIILVMGNYLRWK